MSKYDYEECNLCKKDNKDSDLEMFSYDPTHKEKYILSHPAAYDESDTIHICIKCIERIKAFDFTKIE